MKTHGEIDHGGGRWCEVCGKYHGELYVCEHYSPELQAKLKADVDETRRKFQDPEWLQKQLDHGVQVSALAIMAAFFGVQLRLERKKKAYFTPRMETRYIVG